VVTRFAYDGNGERVLSWRRSGEQKGTLPDGRTVVLNPESTSGQEPTIDVQTKTESGKTKHEKFRYKPGQQHEDPDNKGDTQE
jgi:hypothetical protein